MSVFDLLLIAETGLFVTVIFTSLAAYMSSLKVSSARVTQSSIGIYAQQNKRKKNLRLAKNSQINVALQNDATGCS
jgi:hypothetical protein